MVQQTKRCGALGLLPPKPDVCQACASDHEPEEPHNQRSLYYQYAFLADHGRWPTWGDAMAHCSEGMREMWIVELRKLGEKL
jgi:hypothetical protein